MKLDVIMKKASTVGKMVGCTCLKQPYIPYVECLFGCHKCLDKRVIIFLLVLNGGYANILIPVIVLLIFAISFHVTRLTTTSANDLRGNIKGNKFFILE